MNPPSPVVALVENDLPTNRAFARLLRAHGFTVEAFVSAELLLEHTLAVIDCLLLDIDLDGISGLQLQQLLREQGVGVPVIFITGRDDPADRLRASQMGCSAYLAKPVKGQVLVDAIGAAIGAAPGAPRFPVSPF